MGRSAASGPLKGDPMGVRRKGGDGDGWFEDTVNGENEVPQPVDAPVRGDNPKSSETPRSDSRESFVDSGRFGGGKGGK